MHGSMNVKRAHLWSLIAWIKPRNKITCKLQEMVYNPRPCSETCCSSCFVRLLTRFFLLVFLLEMWAELDTAVQRNQMWPSNYPFRVSNSNPACSPLHPSMFTKDHLRTSNIFPQMTRCEQDCSPWRGSAIVCW